MKWIVLCCLMMCVVSQKDEDDVLQQKLANLNDLQSKLQHKPSKQDLESLKDEELDQKLKFLDSTLSQLNTYDQSHKRQQMNQMSQEEIKRRNQYQQKVDEQKQAQSAKEYYNKMQKGNYLSSKSFTVDKQIGSILKNDKVWSNLKHNIQRVVKDYERMYQLNIPKQQNIIQELLSSQPEKQQKRHENSESFLDFYHKPGLKGVLNLIQEQENIENKQVWVVLNSKVLVLYDLDGEQQDSFRMQVNRLFRLSSLQYEDIFGSCCMKVGGKEMIVLCAIDKNEKYNWIRQIQILQNDILVNSQRVG